MNRISALLILSGLLSLPASGATDSLCWNRDTERMDFYTNPPTRGDNNFFSFTVSGTANVTMIYPGTASMKQLPLSLYELRDPAVQGSQTLVAPLGQGCQNAFLNNLDYFMPTTVDPPAASAAYSGSYDPTKRYPEPETTYSGGGGLNDNFEASSYTCSSSSCPTDSTGGKAWRYVLWPANDNGTQDAGKGSYRTQKMLPQSCNGNGRPNQRISSVDGVTYTNTANPLAEMLFNVAWTVSSIDSSPPSTWTFFTNQSTHPASEPGPGSDANKKSGFCPGCNAGFSVLFSDGRGHDGLETCDVPNGLGQLPNYCNNITSPPTCAGPNATGQPGLGMGAEKDGDDVLDPNRSNGASSLITGPGATYRVTSGNVCPNDFLASVAAWMFATNLGGQPGTNLRLYTVGVGDNYFGELETLRLAASAGHGLYFPASNFAQLERN